jgi:hypothetical protein
MENSPTAKSLSFVYLLHEHSIQRSTLVFGCARDSVSKLKEKGYLKKHATSSLLFSRPANAFNEWTLAGSERSKVAARLREAEAPIRAAADLVSVMVILSIVLPKANLANLKSCAFTQRAIPAARAT